MSAFVIGRLYGWPDFAEDGQDVWVVHVGDPSFFMRVVRRPESALPRGDLAGLFFPLEGDTRWALANLVFFEPQTVQTRTIAQLVGGAIAAIHDPAVTGALALDRRPFEPAREEVRGEDVPTGFVAGVLYDDEQRALSDTPFLVHIGLPPFATMVADVSRDELAEEDIVATIEADIVLAQPVWLSSLGCDRFELADIAGLGAELWRELVRDDMPDLLAG